MGESRPMSPATLDLSYVALKKLSGLSINTQTEKKVATLKDNDGGTRKNIDLLLKLEKKSSTHLEK